MVSVHIVGWRRGLRKVSVTQLLNDQLGCGLAEAKRCTERLLDGQLVVLDLLDGTSAAALVRALDALGADAHVDGETHG